MAAHNVAVKMSLTMERAALTLCLLIFLLGLILLVKGGIGAALYLLQLPQIVPDGLVLLILGLVVPLEQSQLLPPCLGGSFASRGKVLLQLTAGHAERL